MLDESPGVGFDIRRFDLNSYPEIKAKLLAPPKPALRQHQKTWFLRGPIPGPWLTAACGLGVNAIRAGLAIWHVARMSRSPSISLSAVVLERFCIARVDVGLAELEAAGLISVVRQRGKRPSITICDVIPPETQQEAPK